MTKRPYQIAKLIACVLLLLFTQLVIAEGDEKKEFPGRDLYPGVPFIELQEFYQ